MPETTLDRFLEEEAQPRVEAAEVAEIAELRTYVSEGKKGEFDALVNAGVTADILWDTIERWREEKGEKEEREEEGRLLKGDLAKRALKLREREAAGKAMKRVMTLGGVPAVEGRGGVARMYFGKAKGELYVPPTPSTSRLRESPAKKALTPKLGKIREATQFSTGTYPNEDLSALREAGRPRLERLTQGGPFALPGSSQGPMITQLPPSWSVPMKTLYQFLQERDSRATVADVDELGMSRTASAQAISALTSMGYIVKEGKGSTTELILTEKAPR